MYRVHSKVGTQRDEYLLLESGDLPQMVAKHAARLQSLDYGRWYGCYSYDEFATKSAVGDEKLVAESEAFLASIEDQVPMSKGWRNVDDVVGAVPNIPSFLAGHPQCMRRRERTMRETSPLAIYMDLTSSGGIGADEVQKRGVVLLALTRLLVEHRPVELWVGTSLGSHGGDLGSGTVAWRIDTAPLDLARAAFFIGATVMSRGFGYKMCQKELGCGGNWPFDSHSRHCETAKARLANVFPGQEILYVPPVYVSDPMVSDPIGWIKRILESYVGKED